MKRKCEIESPLSERSWSYSFPGVAERYNFIERIDDDDDDDDEATSYLRRFVEIDLELVVMMRNMTADQAAAFAAQAVAEAEAVIAEAEEAQREAEEAEAEAREAEAQLQAALEDLLRRKRIRRGGKYWRFIVDGV
ncbi:hypothetical protein ABFS82_14G102600 [Erythranthe guttata]|uniref:telomere repeat-binding factor 1-like n=1 Tax=Erythranthe guttata TaxID=4155 RepID=UPI00064E090C|nr:PREDICTED: telomere repeat-binding factor 1-like [Erythranthe guttata]XP_012835358.1 PREDICTED: telomere repeat-binding factor 1-like [Erythranthe guttata]XP_012835359.1 PREDICTED: telomere repeat-binding factor 1-like [Erythranthe guttata]XP_012835360.1 PREDICTED: telomere repeat-binding factor 1-like [Erythranthe guttata]XP_012835361.1 PREDICTED: telomere repeat-binding factor 1-like [Erythranthe guttata]XP_012835362.1 PREDICTED: telomere repeat-binding factor 1-like [Erythranthe guttata]|eukprot:XP_012835357.1 PREDICTED: telomere repeat-binding factor 1-like [Erythranthe guttata]